MKWNKIVVALLAMMSVMVLAKTSRASLNGLYTSRVISASNAGGIDTLELPYGPATGLCAPVLYQGEWNINSTSDVTGSQSTGVVSTVAEDGNWFVTVRTVQTGDEFAVQYSCLPWTSFSRGAPSRRGWDGVVSYGQGIQSNNAENPWTTFFVPMSFWGAMTNEETGQQNAGGGEGTIPGNSAAATLCSYNNGPLSVCGQVDSPQPSGQPKQTVALQYEGYSWSPATCSFSQGRTTVGDCIYVPNGENGWQAGLVPASLCDACWLMPDQDGFSVDDTCAADQNTLDCPGTANKFCFISAIFGQFGNTNSLAQVTGQGINGALNVQGDPTEPAPGARMVCVETQF